MIAFRSCDRRFPFLWEDANQPVGRWNAKGQLTHYFSDTPDGAWAEFLRHEEIVDAADLAEVRRALWAVEIGEEPSYRPRLSNAVMTGGRGSWPACRQAADAARSAGAGGITAPSAALQPGGAAGWRVDNGLWPGPARDGKVFALFGRRPNLVGWAATASGRPDARLLDQVRHF